jgi:hypothetical protein
MRSVLFMCKTFCCSAVGVCLAWSAASVAQTAPKSSDVPEPNPAASSSEAAQSTAAPEQAATRDANSSRAPKQAPVPSAVPVRPTESQSTCLPACRSGYTCIASHCVSACNPPCAVGESFTTQGQCQAKPASDQKAHVTVEATHLQNPAMLVGGMVLSSVGAFAGLLGYSVIYRDHFRCDQSRSKSCSTSKAGVGLAVTGGVMFAVGISFMFVGAKRVASTPRAGRAQSPEADSIRLWLDARGLLLSGTF